MLRRGDCHVLRMAFQFGVNSQRKKRRMMRSLKKPFEEESGKVGLCREDALC